MLGSATDSESLMQRRKHDESLIKDRERWAPMLNQSTPKADLHQKFKVLKNLASDWSASVTTELAHFKY